MEKKEETFIYKGLGFPIELVDAPMKKVFGEWVIDIDMNALQLFIFEGLIHKPTPLTGRELRFMRKFQEMSTTEFGEKLGVTHAAVVKWENDQAKISPSQEVYIRLVFLESLQGKSMLDLYKEITPQKLAEAKIEAKNKKPIPLPVHIKQVRSVRVRA